MTSNLICVYSNLGNRSILKMLWVLLMCISYNLTYGQQSDVDPEQTDSQFRAPVIVDGYELFSVRGVSSYPAEARAKTISARIKRAAASHTFSVDSLKKIVNEDHIQLRAGSALLMNIYDEDAEMENISKTVMAELVQAKIRQSIIKYRSERTPRYTQASFFKALGVLGILILSILVFTLIFRRLNIIFQRRIRKRIDNLENVSFKIIQSKQMLGILQFIYQLVRFAVIVFIVLFCIDHILSLFPQTRQISNRIFEILVSPLESLGVGFIKQLPSLVFLLVIFIITSYIIKLFRLLFSGIDLGDISIKDFDPEWAMPTFKIVKLLIIVFALVIAYPYIPGSGSSAFQGISVFLGVLFSLGSSSFIANIIAGYSMTYRRAFKKGDRIQVNEFMGFVLDQSLMVTRLAFG